MALTKKHKIIIISSIAAVLVVTGAVFGILALNGVFSSEPDPEPEEPAEVVSAIDITAPEVQYLYNFFNFKEQCSELGQVRNFYADKKVRDGEPTLTMMLDVALTTLKVPLGTCKIAAGEYDNWTALKERYEKYHDVWMEDDLDYSTAYSMNHLGCYSGSAARSAIKEYFGQDVTLSDDEDTLGIWLHYSDQEDEFFHYIWGKGCFAPTYVRVLTAAERSDQHIYLYETVGTAQDGKLTRLFGENLEEYQYGDTAPEAYIKDHPEKFEQFKWTFEKTDAGNYVFKSLTEVEN